MAIMPPIDDTIPSTQTPDAVENLDRAWSKDHPDGFASLVALGAERMRSGQLDEAAKLLQQAEARNPDDHQVQSLLGLLAYRQRHFTESTRRFASLLLRFPDEPSLMLNLAMAQLGAGRLEAARDTLHQLRVLRPDHARASNVLTLVEEQLADLPAAAKVYHRSGNFAAAAELLRHHGNRIESQSQHNSTDQARSENQVSVPLESQTDDPGLGDSAGVPCVTPNPVRMDSNADSVSPPISRGRSAPPAAPSSDTQAPQESSALAASRPPSLVRGPSRADSVIDLDQVEPVVPSAPVSMRDGLVVVRINESALLRQDRWLGRTGVLEITSAPARQRGQLTGEAMGGSRPMVVVSGQGTALLRVDEPLAVTIVIPDELFVIEHRLLALTGNCRHESANLNLPDGNRLSLLRLRGKGTAVLVADRRPARLRVNMQSPVIVMASAMVAFVGKILPRIDDSSELAGPEPMLNLLGEGETWVDGGGIRS